MFGESEESVILALVPAVVENCVQPEPPFVLYCQTSAVAEDVAEILNPFAVTFDEDFAKAVGTKADLYNLLIAVIVAVVIVLAMNLVGSLLISALVIFPALSAMRLFQNFRSVTVCSAVLSVSCAALGILVSILAGTPVGSTIVAVDILAFLVCSALGRARGGETG